LCGYGFDHNTGDTGVGMKYVALIRAINVGGRNLMRMSDVRACLEAREFQHVSTYIQSGNILFESDVSNVSKLTAAIDKAFSETFNHTAGVFIRSQRQMQKIVADAPIEWKKGATLRCNVAFVRTPLTAAKAVAAIELKPGVDSIKAGDHVVYMSTLITHLKQSAFPKIVGKPIYRDMTVRNYSTCQKILALMDRDTP
jgi:uncharacterized protein (DUF1697 family)